MSKFLYRVLWIAIVGGLLFTQSCSTDFDVNAPKEDITVVFGMLNQSEATQFIKINRTFIGPQDAAEMAQVRDSSEYQALSAVIEQYKEGNLVKTYNLKDTVLQTKEEGYFYGPEQTLYYFYEPNLDQASTYRLTVTVFQGEENEKKVSAETELIKGSQILLTSPSFGFNMGFASVSDYIDEKIEFTSAEDGKRYQLELVFPYQNELVGGGFEDDSVIIKFPVQTVAKADGKTQIEYALKGEEFFQAIKSAVKPITEEPQYIKRHPIRALINDDWGVIVKYRITVACEDLNTYIEVNSPSTGIIQEKPEYTNIDNGIGIFSCRYNVSGTRHIDANTVNELVTGTIGGYTTELGFCDPNDVNDPNYCD